MKTSHKSYTLISWNVLSEELTEAVYDSILPDGSPVFSKNFPKQRLHHLEEAIKTFVRKYKHPIFCFQEVNDSYYEDRNIIHMLTRLLQEHNYRVTHHSFGTVHPIYPELGVMTAIPVQYFDMVDVYVKQILPKFPNCFLSVTITPKSTYQPITIINTHLPARFYDPKTMREICEALNAQVYLTEYNILCGDFNTSVSDAWYPYLLASWTPLTTINDDSISTISIQRRDKRMKTNMVYFGKIDHILYHGNGLLVDYQAHLPLLMEAKSDKSDFPLIVLPTTTNPSDHFPLIAKFSIQKKR
mgnify:CR=1 FL=1